MPLHPLENELFRLARKNYHGEEYIIEVRNCIKQINESKDIPSPSIHAKDESGFTALLLAILLGNAGIAKILLEEKINPNIEDTYWGDVLFEASKFGYLDIVKFLIKKMPIANIHSTDPFEYTALVPAAHQGHKAVVQALIGAGIDLEKKDKFGYTALDQSIRSTSDKTYYHNNHLSIIRLLLEANAHINKPQPLFEFLEKKYNQQKSEDAEDIYACLSILCEQQEKIREEKAAVKQSWLGETLYQKAEAILHNLPQPSSAAYKLRENTIVKNIEEVTTALYPIRFPDEVTKTLIAKYDNPLRHQLFGIQKKPLEIGLKEDEKNKEKNFSSFRK